MPRKQIAVFQHVPFEGLGSIQPWLEAQNIEIAFTRFYAGDPFPDISSMDGLIIMGGPMSIHDEEEFPWLRSEKTHIRTIIDAQKPVIGICLGAQLLAHVLGARVYKNKEKEIGWFPVQTHTPNILQLPQEFMAFHWHGETFDIPEGASLLASTDACQNQIFQWGTHVIGLQCHLEATPETVEKLLKHCEEELAPSPFIHTAETIQRETARYWQEANHIMEKILERLFLQVG